MNLASWCVSLLLLVLAGCLFRFRNSLAEWEHRRNRAARKQSLGADRDEMTEKQNRPVDPLVNLGRKGVGMLMPDTLGYYRLKYTSIALLMLVAAVVFVVW